MESITQSDVDNENNMDALLPNFEHYAEKFRAISNSGFVLLYQLGGFSALGQHSEFPMQWKILYDGKKLWRADPVFYWAMIHNGYCRWSEVNYPDPKKILVKASEHGLHYGTIFSMGGVNLFRRHLLTVARHDRELTNAENELLFVEFKNLLDEISSGEQLTSKEVELIKCYTKGMKQGEAADHLNLHVSSLKQRQKNILRKLNCRTMGQAIACATQRRLL